MIDCDIIDTPIKKSKWIDIILFSSTVNIKEEIASPFFLPPNLKARQEMEKLGIETFSFDKV